MESDVMSTGVISEKSKKALQSEIWEKVRKSMKTEIIHFTETPELQHFAAEKMSKNDNIYGVTWANLVREYLKTAYSGESAEAEVVSYGVTYKVLKRGEVTVFYDTDGNTLFDVENKRLEREYEWLMKDCPQADTENEIPDSTGSDIDETVKENGADQETGTGMSAKQKLEKEMKADKDKSFAEPVIGYLLERCAEDEGLAQDVVQEHKTWKKCLDYIYEKARKQSVGNKAAIRDDVVYEWAEDYYHKDDKAEEEEKARKEAERKEKQKKAAAERAAKAKKKSSKAVTAPEKKADAPKEQPKPKKNNRDMEGQFDIFSMMGM